MKYSVSREKRTKVLEDVRNILDKVWDEAKSPGLLIAQSEVVDLVMDEIAKAFRDGYAQALVQSLGERRD